MTGISRVEQMVRKSSVVGRVAVEKEVKFLVFRRKVVWIWMWIWRFTPNRPVS